MNNSNMMKLILVLAITGILFVLLFAGANSQPGLAINGFLTVCASGCSYSSIQDAVDNALDGETIKVAQGVYTGVQQRSSVTQVVYIDKSLTLIGGYASQADFYNTPAPWQYPTIIDAQDQGRAVYVAEGVTVTLTGLHLVGGNGSNLGGGSGSFPDAGGGLYLDRATTVVSECLIANNRSPMAGGVYVNRGDLIMQHNVISANTAISGNGRISSSWWWKSSVPRRGATRPSTISCCFRYACFSPQRGFFPSPTWSNG